MASVSRFCGRKYCCCCFFPAASFSRGSAVCGRRIGLTPAAVRPDILSNLAATFAALVHAAAAAPSRSHSISSPAVARISGSIWRCCLLKSPDGCVSDSSTAILAARPRSAAALRRSAPGAAPSTVDSCRTAVSGLPLEERVGKAFRAILLQQRKFSTPAGRLIPEQDRRVTRPIRKLLIANRGEIAIRIHRACKEMGIRSVGIFSEADSLALHRQVCDESYALNKELSPVGAYLDYPEIIKIAQKHKVDAIHPGYGFLSENSQFAAAVEDEGLMLVGPSPRVIALMGDKVQARLAAVRSGVQAVPGTDTPIRTLEEANAASSETGFPLMLKAAYGGGGRGMRRVFHEMDLPEAFERAMSEAEAAFGDGALFVEKLVERGVHIEVQILADHYGDVVHLRERDCTVQRRHQKVVEIAPAPFLEEDVRESILADAVALMRSVGYQNAGTVEFLVSREPMQAPGAGGRLENERRVAAAHVRTEAAAHVALSSKDTDMNSADEGSNASSSSSSSKPSSPYYFIEVNPRLQVEHTVSEEVTGIDIVKTQIALREGASLQELGITQSRVDAACTSEGPFALQCRITTEDSQRNFQPSSGRIELYQPSTGPGIRLDGAIGASGAVVTPYYDSLLVKIIAKGRTFTEAVERAQRALRETKIRGVTTNIPFIQNVLQHPDFLTGKATTRFVDDHQMLLYYDPVDLSSQNICVLCLSAGKYLAQVAVNGPLTQLVKADAEPERKPVSPPPLPPAAAGAVGAFLAGAGSWTTPPEDVDLHQLAAVAHQAPRGLKAVLTELGPRGFARSVRERPQVLLCDTTLRDAHQSLLATRLRTYDMVKVAPAYAYHLPMLFSLENWGGATFDVAYRFLRESPWRRLQLLREAIPNIPFQMLLRGANAVGYTAYPDNVVEKFCVEAAKYGMDIFRVFDSLNYVENLKSGIQAAGAAGGVVEAAMVYTGNVADPQRQPYTLEYYLDLARQLVATDCHMLCIKDMAGLLTPKAAKLLVGSLRQEFPEMPIHVHTHDTAGCGVASLIAAAEAGADVLDVAIDAMAGLTSQPPMGAIVSILQHTSLDPGIDLKAISVLSDYFEHVRLYYAPFEATATLKSVSCDVYQNEIPGGQYTNLHMQAFSLGLADQWPKIKAAYVAANRLLGNPPKVTPTSKVVGDLAQFMVQNGLDEAAVNAQADVLSFPSSVVEYFQGCLGQPPFGFPEPFRTKVLGGKTRINGRPGASLQPVNWTEVREQRERTHGRKLLEADLISSVLYPEVFDDFQRFLKTYGDVSMLPTPNFFKGVLPGEAITVRMAGREVNIKYIAQTHVHPDGTRDVFFDVMGLPRAVNVPDTKAVKVVTNLKADPANPKHIGSPMPGNVMQIKIQRGQGVQKGQQVAIVSAMKMETAVVAPIEGIVREIPVKAGDAVQQGDLLIELQ